MIFHRNTKILRIKFESISVKEKESLTDKEKITFFVNDIKFETDKSFVSEKSFMDSFLMGTPILCTHKFKETDTHFETILTYNVFYTQEGFVMVVLL